MPRTQSRIVQTLFSLQCEDMRQLCDNHRDSDNSSFSTIRPTRRREQGRPEGPPVRYPQGSDNRGNLAATRGAALGTASGALLLTRRAHNCGAH